LAACTGSLPRIDGEFELMAGALSSDPDGLSPRQRRWGSIPNAPIQALQEMAEAEAARSDGIEAVAIVTPNHMHFPAAKRVSGSGHSRDLRQAADLQPCGCQKACRDCP
jgi:predicted dehydrogenase